MKTTTYKCDRCGAEDTTNKIEILNVGVHVGGYNEKYSSYGTVQTRVQFNQEWCLECRIKAGLKEKPTESTVEQKPVTLEDLVMEIAYNAACDAISNSR